MRFTSIFFVAVLPAVFAAPIVARDEVTTTTVTSPFATSTGVVTLVGSASGFLTKGGVAKREASPHHTEVRSGRISF